jgi:hypothetical protein
MRQAKPSKENLSKRTERTKEEETEAKKVTI